MHRRSEKPPRRLHRWPQERLAGSDCRSRSPCRPARSRYEPRANRTGDCRGSSVRALCGHAARLYLVRCSPPSRRVRSAMRRRWRPSLPSGAAAGEVLGCLCHCSATRCRGIDPLAAGACCLCMLKPRSSASQGEFGNPVAELTRCAFFHDRAPWRGVAGDGARRGSLPTRSPTSSRAKRSS